MPSTSIGIPHAAGLAGVRGNGGVTMSGVGDFEIYGWDACAQEVREGLCHELHGLVHRIHPPLTYYVRYSHLPLRH